MRTCAIEDKTEVVVVASYRSVSRNPIRFKALVKTIFESQALLIRYLLHNCLLTHVENIAV